MTVEKMDKMSALHERERKREREREREKFNLCKF